MQKKSLGISLISLIITIIVIIILAAIVIFSGMGTPEKAQLAGVISDIDNVQTAVDQAYYGFYTEKSVAGEVWTKSQYYEAVATGETDRTKLKGTGIVDISDEGMVKMNLPKYEGRKWGVAVEDIDETTKVGSVVLYPGFETDGKIYSTLLDAQNDGRDSQLPLDSDTGVSLASVLNVGDYVEYKGDSSNSYTLDSSLTGYPSANGTKLVPEDTAWRVWSKNADGSVVIVPSNRINNFYLGNGTGFINSLDVIEAVCDLYTNSSLGVTASDIRSMKIEDLEDPKVCANMIEVRDNYQKNTNWPQYGQTNAERYGYAGFTNGTFYMQSDGVTIKKTPDVASSTNPIVIKQTYYYNDEPDWNSLENDKFSSETYGDLISDGYRWLASACADIDCEDGVNFTVRYIGWGDLIDAVYLEYSESPKTNAGSGGVIPMVKLSAKLQVDKTDTSKDGSSETNAWKITK